MTDRTFAAIATRRAFMIRGAEDKYRTLADVGFDRDEDDDKDWVTPYQKISDSPKGPVLVALHWLDVPSIEDNRRVLKKKGYLPDIPFNLVLDLALDKAGLQRTAIYVTQAFHLLPVAERSARIPRRHLYESFRCITRHEVEGRQGGHTPRLTR